MLRIAILVVAIASCLNGAERRQLFNGKDMTGWEFSGRVPGTAGFSIENGTIQTGGAKGMLWYKGGKLSDCTIRVVYKMSNENGNSGVFIRIPDVPQGELDAIHKGIEVQIDDRDDEWHRTGVLYSMTKAKAVASKPPGEWNTMEITLNGLRTVVHVNGVLITDYDGVAPVPAKTKPYEPERGPRPASGYIALQNHDPSAVFNFKEISVVPLKK